MSAVTNIFDYMDAQEGDGYGHALINQEGIVVQPYLDPSDFPTLEVTSRGRGVGTYEGWWICRHSGILEENPRYFAEAA